LRLDLHISLDSFSTNDHLYIKTTYSNAYLDYFNYVTFCMHYIGL